MTEIQTQMQKSTQLYLLLSTHLLASLLLLSRPKLFTSAAAQVGQTFSLPHSLTFPALGEFC
jgi:hypothetical protein